jgi:hypothetical protein
MTDGVSGLMRDKTRPSRIPPLSTEVEQHVVARTLEDPPVETTHWTAAAMAKESGISVSSVQRIWRKHGLQPHRMRQFKLSNDPQFAAKLHEIVGLYVDPPAHTVVLSIDEKSQIQALDRTLRSARSVRIALNQPRGLARYPRCQSRQRRIASISWSRHIPPRCPCRCSPASDPPTLGSLPRRRRCRSRRHSPCDTRRTARSR